MKKLLLLYCLFCCHNIFAQVTKTTNNTVLVKVIPAKAFRGQDFILSIEVKNQRSDSSGNVSISTMQVGKSDWDFLKSPGTSALAPADSQWHQLEVSGQVNMVAEKLWLYLVTNGNGDFFFDNIRLKVKGKDEKWQDISIPNADFEKSTATQALKGLENTKSAQKIPGNRFSIHKDIAPSRNQVLQLHTEGGTKTNKIIYGYNQEAGNYIQTSGARIYYEVYGEGPPLLLLHGNGGSINTFAPVIPELAKHYQVIAVDTRGQGNSTDDGRQVFTYELFAHDMKILSDSLNIKNAAVVGWSDGGIIGLLLASKYPEFVNKLVTMGANLNPDETSIRPSMLQQVRKDIAKIEKRNDPKEQTTLKLMQLMLTEPHIDPATLQSVKAKTLIMAGEKDVILETHTRQIAAAIPGAELRILKGQSHWIVTEHPALFTKEILDFLSPQK